MEFIKDYYLRFFNLNLLWFKESYNFLSNSFVCSLPQNFFKFSIIVTQLNSHSFKINFLHLINAFHKLSWKLCVVKIYIFHLNCRNCLAKVIIWMRIEGRVKWNKRLIVHCDDWSEFFFILTLVSEKISICQNLCLFHWIPLCKFFKPHQFYNFTDFLHVRAYFFVKILNLLLSSLKGNKVILFDLLLNDMI